MSLMLPSVNFAFTLKTPGWFGAKLLPITSAFTTAPAALVYFLSSEINVSSAILFISTVDGFM